MVRAFGLARAASIALALACHAPVHARDDQLPDDADIRWAEKQVEPQPWYPEGYYDVRVAAEAQARETLRGKELLVDDCASGTGRCYDLRTPLSPRVNGDESDRTLVRYGNVALEISRIRQEMHRIGYPRSVYATPLAAYERQLVEAAAAPGTPSPDFEGDALRQLAKALDAGRAHSASGLPKVIAEDAPTATGAGGNPAAAAAASVIAVRASGPSADQYPAGKKLRGGDKIILKVGDTLVLLDSSGTRTLKGPGVFQAARMGGAPRSAIAGLFSGKLIRRTRTGAVRGVASGPVVLSTSPAGGEVLLISAFAFKLCAKKKLDIWDRFACKWNEVETGSGQFLSGRYVYQVRWPDGVVRKGTREILPDYEGDDSIAVTFKKAGS